MGRRGRRKTQPTDDWQELLPLFEWPEQEAYEVLRPLVLFGGSVTERARETGIPERTLYRRAERFEEDGRQGDSLLPEGEQEDRLPGSREVVGGRRGRPPRQTAGPPERR